MREKIKLLRHFGILFLTIMIFTIGTFIGAEIEQLRVQNLYTNLQEQDLDYQKIVTENNYLNYLLSINEKKSNPECIQIKNAYYKSIENLDDSRIKLENYINSAKVKEEEYQRLKEHYSNLQINYWILANKINNICENNLNPILYFYGEKKICPSCQYQGIHLDYVKQRLKDNILIFSIDATKSGVIELLAQKYEIYNRELPVIVIEEKIYSFKNNEEIFQILCDNGLEDNICKT